MIALCYLLNYSNLELCLKKKDYETISFKLLVRGRSCFFGADNYLYFVALSDMSILSIEGPNC